MPYVRFIDLKTGRSVTQTFTSAYLARQFLNRAKRSKKIRVVAYSEMGD